MPAQLDYVIEQTTLANGLRVVVNPDPTSPGVAVNLWYHVGSGDEQPGRTGFAHLFEHLMFAGSDQVGNGEHLAVMQAAGGSVNATTSFERTNYFETVPRGALEIALWLEADRLASLTVDQTNLDTQRQVVKEEKRQRYDNVPYGDQLELLMALNFPAEHPYAHTTIGAMADLDAATLTEVQDFFRSWYSPSNAVLTLAGAVGADEGFRLADEYFGTLTAVPAPVRSTTAALPPHTGVPRLVVQRDVPRSALHLGWLTPAMDHADAPAVEQALAVLGGGQSSRLHKDLVRDRQLAEGAVASSIQLARGNTLALVSARAREGVSLDTLEEAVLEHLSALGTDGPSADEVDRASAGYEREWLSELAEIDSRADQIGAFATLFGDPTLLNSHLAQVQAVTADDVRRVSAAYLAPDQRSALEYHQSPATPAVTSTNPTAPAHSQEQA